MGLSKVQKGLIGQMEFIKLGTMGSFGELDYASPYADDDRRDHEIHRRGRFGPELAVQTKIATHLDRQRRGRPQLQIRITVTPRRLISSRMYWYFLAFLDLETARFADPCFLVPSTLLHRRKQRSGKNWLITFEGALSPASRDRWVPYRVDNAQVGKRLLKILDDLQRSPLAATESRQVREIPGASIIRRRKRAGR